MRRVHEKFMNICFMTVFILILYKKILLSFSLVRDTVTRLHNNNAENKMGNDGKKEGIFIFLQPRYSCNERIRNVVVVLGKNSLRRL